MSDLVVVVDPVEVRDELRLLPDDFSPNVLGPLLSESVLLDRAGDLRVGLLLLLGDVLRRLLGLGGLEERALRGNDLPARESVGSEWARERGAVFVSDLQFLHSSVPFSPRKH